MKKFLVLKSTLALALAAPLLASAESQLVVGAGSATAQLDFRIVIPRVLFLGVGAGANATPIANNAAIDTVTFDFTGNAADLGTGAPAGATAGNVVPVRVLGNNGQITLTAATTGPLTNPDAPGYTIPWSEITASSSLAALPSPAMVTGGAGGASNVTLSPGSTRITNRSANWTFAFANTALLPPGTFTGRVTYTAAMP